ncbi:phosphoribosylanthranilate isomerase [Marinomonas algicola]|jgi:phosphoribosylanthranilate isomerase|uniref:phosphoribosylanthranilate isomerase n=1 Tax=Marinomonas algicola TaxID=2773454 RepID=UPI00174EA5CB|nr:phosphoribosylanthranilate isomerase [Marinomonas algicola]
MSHRVKICGITNLEDAIIASSLGADALGFVFYKKSPRYVSPNVANEILKQLPPFVTPVALFVDANEGEVNDVIESNSRWVIQFHGNETEQECLSFNRPYIKALRVQSEETLLSQLNSYPSAAALLLDAYKEGVPGGTGETFNWDIIPKELTTPIILAGGLTPSNITDAIKVPGIYAVDVSGGVELTKGIKDKTKLEKFILGVKRG